MTALDRLNTNDVLDALTAGIEAIQRDKAATTLADYRIHILRELRDGVQRQSRAGTNPVSQTTGD